jgi:aspartyl-tRNA(Asn)/glutamyl-tRNA(Gln) amidotransferase subunit A
MSFYIVATAEASSNLARFDGVQYGLRSKAQGLIEMYKKKRADKGSERRLKEELSSAHLPCRTGYYDAYYLRALKVRTLIKQDFDKAWNEVLRRQRSPVGNLVS